MEVLLMLSWALALFILAAIAGFFGFGGIAGAAAGIAKILFLVFLILLIVSAKFGALRHRPAVEVNRPSPKENKRKREGSAARPTRI